MRLNINLLRAAARLSTPEQTATAGLLEERGDEHAHIAVDLSEGWSPRPTQEPLIPGLAKRQLDGTLRTCGFINENRGEPFTCGISSVCVTDEFLGYAGCCDADNVESCNIATACFGDNDREVVGGEVDKISNSTMICSSSSCARAFFDYSTEIYTQWFCYRSLSATVYPTYSNPIGNEEPFSASALPVARDASGSLEIANDDNGDESNNNEDGGNDDNNDGNDDNNDLNDDLNDGNTEGNESGSENGENVGAIAGGVVGGVVVFSVAGFLIWWLFRRQRQKYRDLLNATTRPEPVLKAEMPSTNTVNSPHTASQGIVPTSTTLNELYDESTIPQIATTHMLPSDNVAGTYKQTG